MGSPTTSLTLGQLRAKLQEAWRSPAAARSEPKPVVFHGHYYQPWRIVTALRQEHTFHAPPMPEASAGNEEINWTNAIYHQSLVPLMADGPERSALRHMSFNFGPTLIEQLRFLAPEFIGKLKETDSLSARDHDGHGNAMAQAFAHTILPLDTAVDQAVQVSWGLEHFKGTFNREAEGMWLPECAVDLQVLSLLKEQGVDFVILSPYSAKRVCYESGWEDVFVKNDLPTLDHSRIFSISLPTGKEMNAFLYDPWISRQLAFSDVLDDVGGHRLADMVQSRFHYHQRMMPAAVDGETFGHHKKSGALTLSNYVRLAAGRSHHLTNFAALLARAKESSEAILPLIIHEPSAWSCGHGVERWRSDCGCDGSNPWRSDYRAALRFLADRFDRLFQEKTAHLFKIPLEEMQLKYVDVLLGRTAFEDFIGSHLKAGTVLSEQKRHTVSIFFNSLVPRHTMFVSCAWFFHGMGLETGLALGFAHDLIRGISRFDKQVELAFIEQLAGISNSEGAKDKGQPLNAAQAYFWARNGQVAWAEQLAQY